MLVCEQKVSKAYFVGHKCATITKARFCPHPDFPFPVPQQATESGIRPDSFQGLALSGTTLHSPRALAVLAGECLNE